MKFNITIRSAWMVNQLFNKPVRFKCHMFLVGKQQVYEARTSCSLSLSFVFVVGRGSCLGYWHCAKVGRGEPPYILIVEALNLLDIR